MSPDTFKAIMGKLRLTVQETATMCGLSRSQVYKHLRSESDPEHRTPSKATERLLKAYLSGYRPSDWPKTARKTRDPISEIEWEHPDAD